MKLYLKSPLPIPLKASLRKNSSDIWLQELSLVKGNLVFVQAPSGTGKTTLVHMLYGMRKDFDGIVKWGDKDINTIDAAQLSHLRTSYLSIVFQDMRLFPSLTAWENIELKRLLTNTVTTDVVDIMLQRLGILERRNALASTLSYGEQQRVAIIRALVQPFDWLLLDEPFSHLDQVNIDKAASLISEVVAMNSAGMLLADLEPNNYFSYHKTLYL